MPWYKPWTWGDQSAQQQQQSGQLVGQGDEANAFANRGQDNFGALGGEASTERDYLRQLAMGQHSVSAEQLRQGLQQNLAVQSSMAAGAAPQNAAMAARTAAIQSGRLGSGMAGQQAIAGLQEQQMAHNALRDAILQQRQQEMQAALGSRQNAISAYGGYKPEGSTLDKWGPAAAAAGAIVAKSDRRAKKDIHRADREADDAIKSLRAYTFAYKDERDGAGKQTGVMAQDLEKAGLKHAVIDTPDGKYVHGGKLSTANTALIARLGERVQKLEGKGRK